MDDKDEDDKDDGEEEEKEEEEQQPERRNASVDRMRQIEQARRKGERLRLF